MMNGICLIILWFILCEGNKTDCVKEKYCHNECHDKNHECSCDRSEEREIIRDNRCVLETELPYLPGGKPFGAFEGNCTCGCEEQTI